MNTIERTFYLHDAVTVARALLGKYLVRKPAYGNSTIETLTARIVETEAYTQDDPASHSYRGRTARTASMFEEGGIAYVYLIYGMYDCLNVVCGKSGEGSAVLIRACEPINGERLMWANRFPEKPFDPKKRRLILNGPGKLCRAFGITRKYDDGADLVTGNLVIMRNEEEDAPAIRTSPRIGITRAGGLQRRFFIPDNPYVSGQ